MTHTMTGYTGTEMLEDRDWQDCLMQDMLVSMLNLFVCFYLSARDLFFYWLSGTMRNGAIGLLSCCCSDVLRFSVTLPSAVADVGIIIYPECTVKDISFQNQGIHDRFSRETIHLLIKRSISATRSPENRFSVWVLSLKHPQTVDGSSGMMKVR